MTALLDTSIFIAAEVGRPLESIPDDVAISVVTIIELNVGVLVARSARERSRRLSTLLMVTQVFDPLPIDSTVAVTAAEFAVASRESGHRPKLPDTLIAATAATHGLTLYTQDRGFAIFPDLDARYL